MSTNQQTYTDPRGALGASGKIDKAVIKNLRHQSPFNEGSRNRDYVNPSLASNLVFYNHGNEKVDNPHIDNRRHEYRPSGMNLNNYVSYEAGKASLPTKTPPGEKRFADKPKIQAAPQIDEDARSNAPSRHYQRSQNASERAHSANVRNKDAASSSAHHHADHKRCDTYEVEREPSDNGRVQKIVHVIHDRDRNAGEHSVRSGRNKTAERREPRSEGNIQVDDRYKVTTHEHEILHASTPPGAHHGETLRAVTDSGKEIVYDLGHHKIGVISKDKKPIVVIGEDGISRCGTIYEKVSDSQISHPENLICDGCANQNMAQDKVRDARNQKEQDMEFARRVNDNLRQQIEDERRRQLEKLKSYQDSIDNQRQDQLNRKRIERENEEAENEKIRRQMANRDDEAGRLERERLRKENFIGDLRDQIDQKRALENMKREKEALEDKKTPNLLIDDAWRGPHREAMKDYYKNFLTDQVSEQERLKELAKERSKAEDEDYKRKMQNLNMEEYAKKRELEENKKKIFMDEISKQLADKDKLREFENNIKNAEDENYRRKLEQDRQVYLDNVFKKKKQMDDYLNNLGKQIVDKEMEKRIQELESKKRYNTTLCLGKKSTKCYNCAVCRNIYPLKMLNKKQKAAQ